MCLLVFDFALPSAAALHDCQTAHQPAAVVDMDLFRLYGIFLLQHLIQLFVAVFFQIRISGRSAFLPELIVIETGFQIQAGAAADDLHVIALTDDFPCHLLKVGSAVFLHWRKDIDQIMVDALHLLLRYLAGADIHAAVYLDRIAADDLTAELLCQLYGKGCLSGSGRSGNDQHLLHRRNSFVSSFSSRTIKVGRPWGQWNGFSHNDSCLTASCISAIVRLRLKRIE